MTPRQAQGELSRTLREMGSSRYLLTILLIIFLFLMHIFIPNLGGVMAHPREYLIWIGIGTIVLLGILKVIKDGILRESPFKVYILLFSALLLSGSIFNPIKNMDVFVINSIRLTGGIILWFALMQFDLSAKERLSILSLIFISAVIESVIGVMQFFGLYRYIPITPAPEVGMVGGVFQQKNLFASWIATGLIISLYFITTYRFKAYNRKMKAIFLAAVVLLSLSLIIAGSRTGLLGIALGMLIILPLRARHYSAVRKNLIIWFMVFFIGIGGGYYLLSVKDKLGIEKLVVKQIEWFQFSATAPRLLMWRVSLEMFKEKPIFGQGFANFGSLYMYHQAEAVKSNPKYKELLAGDYTNHPHNEVFRIMAESGIAGILAILIVVAGFIKMLLKLKWEKTGLYVAILMPLLIHMMFEYPLELSTSHYFVFLIFLYMATSHFVKEKQLKLTQHLLVVILSFSVLLYISLTGYTVKTLYDYMNMVIYHKEYSEDKIPSIKNIEGAMDNIYLRNWAKPMYMFAKAEESIEDVEKNGDFLNNFLKWSSLEKQRQPVMHVFSYDANVLLSMGIHYKEHVYFDEAMKSVEEGLSLYPNNRDLKALRQRIASEFFRIIFHSFQKRG